MSENIIRLPECISSLAFSFRGESLYARRPSPDHDTIEIVFCHSHVEANIAQESGESNYGQALHRYWGGGYKVYTPYDDEEPTSSPIEFEAWLRSEVQSMVSFGIRDLLLKLPSQLKPSQPDFLDQLLKLADELAALDALGYSAMNKVQDAVELLLLGRMIRQEGWRSSSEERVAQLIKGELFSTMYRSDAYDLGALAIHLLPTPLPPQALDAVSNIVDSHLGYFAEVNIGLTQGCAYPFLNLPRGAQVMFRERVLPKVSKLDALLSLAELFGDHPEEAEGYLDAALALDPQDALALGYMQRYYAQRGMTTSLKRISGELERVGLPVEITERNIEEVTQTYRGLTEAFKSLDPSAEIRGTEQLILGLETALNGYWSAHPDPSSLERLSCAGTWSFVRWLAREGRSAEIVMIFKLMTFKPSGYLPLQESCSLELQRLVGVGIEALLNVEPQEEADLNENELSLEEDCFYTAVDLRSKFESVIPTWEEPGVLMALAKLSARTGHVDWAMDCVEKLVEAGRSAHEIAQEPAFEDLKTHERFLALLSS